jgi:hypothetical protein
VAFRYLAADQHPDHDTLASFRQEHLDALAGLFVQALKLCQKAGLVKLGNVAIDGTKVMANASNRRSVSYQKISDREQYWKNEVSDYSSRHSEQIGTRVNVLARATVLTASRRSSSRMLAIGTPRVCRTRPRGRSSLGRARRETTTARSTTASQRSPQ